MGDSENSSPEDNLAMRTRRLSFTVDKWMKKLEKGEMSAASFRQSWKTTVPQVYFVERNRNYPEVRLTESESVLISSIEQFIAGGDEMLEKLQEMDSPPSMCGRVFKLGEPTYFCRECGKDLTCVLCADCFKKSVHRHHKYKMGTSHGGGCCDCGDVEAWKSDPFCDIHAKGAEKTESKGLPEDVAVRARIAFEAILTYAYDLLTVTHTMDLPADLRLIYDFSSTGYFCLVLFNDETHSFEQVLSAMAKVMKSPQRDVIEVVNKVDREGRAMVKCAEFQVCKDLREELLSCMSRSNQQPIKAEVFHVDVIAHQTFALKLLSWLHKVVSCSEGLRSILNSVILGTGLVASSSSIVERLLTEDVNLWKSARVAWHRLLMASLLMDYESKKSLAKIFSKKYGVVMKEFIRDDHDHSISIVSLSVQLFTVPTLAHYLIAEERVLFILWNTFFSECLPKLNYEGKLVFERNVPNTAFRRALYILGDIKLLLCATPTAWTDALRKGFMQGFQHMMKLLRAMQDMDLVKREVAQHVEYEPEWEPVFLLHMRVANILSLVVEWCASDEQVLVQSCRCLLSKLAEPKLLFPAEPIRRVYSVAGHEANCIVYDVAEESVSMHLPMSRLLAGLYLHLEKYNKTLNDVRPASATLTVEEMIEHVMRLEVLIAQVHAGMWRRNGYALVTQISLYNGPKCRTEMLDRDIVLLQMGSSLLDSDQFLIQLLNKFNLLNWAEELFELSPDDDKLRRTIYLVEEFLGLVITVVGERYMPGVGQVTEDDEIKKDIIQQLCIKPMSHSELSSSFRDEVARENRVEDVIQEVAEFKKPATGKGVYELKKEYYNDYNIFYYHYTREERSKSEESQRKRRKAAGELECCPPPKLPPLTKTFSRVANLLQCDVMMHILRTVLERSANLLAQSFSETQLHKALHLIGYGLHEEEANPDIKFTKAADKVKMEALLEALVKSPRVEALKDLLRWTLLKYQQVKARKTEEPVATTASEVALQADKAKERRAKLAAEKRAKIMAQMTAMQKSFMKENAKLFNLDSDSDKSKETSESAMDIFSEEVLPVALGEKQTPCVMSSEVHTCILCQEDDTVNMVGSVLVLAAYVQRSSVLNQNRQQQQSFNPIFLNSSLGLEIHTSTCGHMMHLKCWKHYFQNLTYKATRQHRIRQPPSYDIDKKEFLCPLCACLSNTVLPLVPTPQAYRPVEPTPYRETFYEWIQRNEEMNHVTWLDTVWKRGQSPSEEDAGRSLPSEAVDISEPSSSSSVAGTSAPGHSSDSSSDVSSGSPGRADLAKRELALKTHGIAISPSLVETITTFARRGLQKTSLYIKVNDERIVPFISAKPILEDDKLMPYIAWKSCAFTIHSQEWLLRDAGKSLLGDMASRQQDCLRALSRIMPLLVDSSNLFPVAALLLDKDKDSYGPCILEWDSFGLLVSLTFCHAEKGVPTGKGCEQHCVRLALFVEILRILLTSKLWSNEESHPMDVEDDEFSELKQTEDTNALLTILQALREECAVQNVPLPDGNILWAQVKEACRPFLRCAVLFFHFLLSIPAPSTLCEPGGDTFPNLLSYLGLSPLCGDLLSGPEIVQLTRLWAGKPAVQKMLSSPAAIIKPPTRINRLVDLPEDYSDFMNAVSSFQCPRSQQAAESRNPTMCLVCGEMLCSQNYCCQVEIDRNNMGACMYHTRTCGFGVGVFLRVRECEVLLLSSFKKGCFMPSPYVDDYGETDQGLHRGNRLRLSPQLYRELELLWLSHSIREQISRSLDRGTNQMIAQWNYL